ncbi:MAG: hypothetical protein ABIH88_01980 [Patescibacteria group bacterium]
MSAVNFRSNATPEKVSSSKGGGREMPKISAEKMQEQVREYHEKKERGSSARDILNNKIAEVRAKLESKKAKGKFLTAKERHDLRMADKEEALIQHTDAKEIREDKLQSAQTETPLVDEEQDLETEAPKTEVSAEAEPATEREPERLTAEKVVEIVKEMQKDFQKNISKLLEKFQKENPELSKGHEVAQVKENAETFGKAVVDIMGIKQDIFAEASNREKKKLLEQELENRIKTKDELETNNIDLNAKLGEVDEAVLEIQNSDLNKEEKQIQLVELEKSKTELEKQQKELQDQIVKIEQEENVIKSNIDSLDKEIKEAEKNAKEQITEIFKLRERWTEVEKNIIETKKLIDKADSDIKRFQDKMDSSEINSVKNAYQKLVANTTAKQQKLQNTLSGFNKLSTILKSTLSKDMAEIVDLSEDGNLEDLKIKEGVLENKEDIVALAKLISDDVLKDTGKEFADLHTKAQDEALEGDEDSLWKKIWHLVSEVIGGTKYKNQVQEIKKSWPDNNSADQTGWAMWRLTKKMK